MKTVLSFLISMTFAASAIAQTADWRKTWDETLAAAKKEGKVVIIGSPDPVMRGQINPKFTERYGIDVEYIAGSSSQLIERVRTERASGLYSTDIFMSGANSTLNTLMPAKMLDPIKPLLILPEVTEGKYWKKRRAVVRRSRRRVRSGAIQHRRQLPVHQQGRRQQTSNP